MKTNLMHYLSSVYFVSQLLHISGIFVAHHQKVYCIYTTKGTCCAFQLTVCWPANRKDKLCTKLVFVTRMYPDARSTKHKIFVIYYEDIIFAHNFQNL